MTPIAFLGLGTMGTGMAKRLLSAGFAVSVHNRTRGKADSVLAAGAKWAASPREAAASAHAVISMVADDAASRSFWLGHDGALAGARPGALAIECSTLSVEWSAELRAAAEANGLKFLDAPVAGSKPQAAAGELVIMAGGDAAALEEARPILTPMSKRIVHVGGAGAGTKVKLLNNFLSAVQIASFAEGLALAERDGLDVDKAMQIILAGAPSSPMVKTIYERIKAGGSEPQFTIKLMAKDLNYALQQASKVELPLRTAAAALAIFQGAIAAGDGDGDLSAVVRQFAQN